MLFSSSQETNNPNYLQNALDGRFRSIVRLVRQQGRTDAFTETGREGLLCVLRVQAQQAAAGLTYSGTAAQSLDDCSEDENMASSSQEKQYRCASAPRSLLQPPLLMLTSCLHHTKQQTWIDRPFSRAAPSL
ncbi:unnamed protein product [Pleuronectes platessa]|uniref:Uncharacterized protein n=1 Tax=Pleuronectes platessa TaxID=8262 RepID=A0A9N7VW41_PLEPL|nr:unnamed protein product [Pleuronectes platessa]